MTYSMTACPPSSFSNLSISLMLNSSSSFQSTNSLKQRLPLKKTCLHCLRSRFIQLTALGNQAVLTIYGFRPLALRPCLSTGLLLRDSDINNGPSVSNQTVMALRALDPWLCVPAFRQVCFFLGGDINSKSYQRYLVYYSSGNILDITIVFNKMPARYILHISSSIEWHLAPVWCKVYFIVLTNSTNK